MARLIPSWAHYWLIVSGLICLWDASFIILRPSSMPGGPLHSIWKPYALYMQVDKRYADMADPFVYAVSLMNLVEVALSFLAVYLCEKGNKMGVLVAFTVSVMTCWKTLLYLLQYVDFVGGGHYHGHNDLFSIICLLWVPNGIWIAFPFAVIAKLWPHLGVTSPAVQQHQHLLQQAQRKTAKNASLKKKYF